MTSPLKPGCEPFSALGGPDGVLVLHGFTGSPYSMRPLAEAIANRGYTVESPRLPGHGTAIEDLIPLRWEDWSGAAEAAYVDLAGRCTRVALVGLSVGGALSAWLAARHPDVVALTLINPLVKPIDAELRDGGAALLATGVEKMEGLVVLNDIAKPGGDERGYNELPLAASLSLQDGLEEVASSLGNVTCPTLVLTSREDHTVAPENSEFAVGQIAGPVEHLWLERSYHVATLDYDAAVVEAETCRFLETCFEVR
jgi:carboxylesterase